MTWANVYRFTDKNAQWSRNGLTSATSRTKISIRLASSATEIRLGSARSLGGETLQQPGKVKRQT